MTIMKNKYQRMNKEQKKQLYNDFKELKPVFTKKMERMLLICKIGIIYSIVAILYDLLLTNNYVMTIIDGIILLFCIGMFIKTNNTKIDFLNDFAIKKDKENRKEIVKKHKKY